VIIVAGYLTLDPAKRDEALAAIAKCVEPTRKEEGNIDYRFSPDLDDPNRMNLLEQWADEDAINLHMASEHLAEFMTAIGGCLGGPAEVIRYDVSGSKPLF